LIAYLKKIKNKKIKNKKIKNKKYHKYCIFFLVYNRDKIHAKTQKVGTNESPK